jgi:hypothetical protein
MAEIPTLCLNVLVGPQKAAYLSNFALTRFDFTRKGSAAPLRTNPEVNLDAGAVLSPGRIPRSRCDKFGAYFGRDDVCSSMKYRMTRAVYLL